MYDIVLAAVIAAIAVAGLYYIFRRIRELPASYQVQAIDADLADRVFTHRIQWLFLALFAIAISILALDAYQALRPLRLGGAELPQPAASQSVIDQKATETRSALDRLERLVERAATPAARTTRVDIGLYGKVFVGLIILGTLLIIAGLCVDYGRAEKTSGPPIPVPPPGPAARMAHAGPADPATQSGPMNPPTQSGHDPATGKTSSLWATLLKSATLYKVAGTFCLFGSMTLATFKFDSLVRFTTPEAPAAMEVTLLHFVDQVAPKPPVVIAEQPSPPTNIAEKTPLLSAPQAPPANGTTEIDCGREGDNERFVVKTFKSGKTDELEDRNDAIARLNTILDAIETRARNQQMRGLVFIGSSDGSGLGKASREQYGDNSTLARKRAEFVQEQFQEQLMLRKDAPRPHWILLLNPAVPTVRLAADDGKRFDTLRAVQICVAWTKADESARL